MISEEGPSVKQVEGKGSFCMDSIIFDLDGTLWDSRKTVVEAWNHVLDKHYKELPKVSVEDFKRVMGLPMNEIAQQLFPDLSLETSRILLKKCEEEENDLIKEQGGGLYPGLEAALSALIHQYKLFIVSNCQAGYIESFYDYHQLGKYFTDEENPGRTGLSKGENIQLVIERNKLRKPVYVGDTAGDQTAAAYAEIPFIFADYGFGQVETYDGKINQLEELPSLIEHFKEGSR